MNNNRSLAMTRTAVTRASSSSVFRRAAVAVPTLRTFSSKLMASSRWCTPSDGAALRRGRCGRARRPAMRVSSLVAEDRPSSGVPLSSSSASSSRPALPMAASLQSNCYIKG